jgi:hypothetical protein
VKRKIILIFLLTALLVCCKVVPASTLGNLKYDVVESRMVVSCIDGKSPRVRVINRPTGGYIAIVDCDKER